MAFVCEKIREEDREYFESIGFTQILGEPSKALWWAIDKDREIILISRGGMIGVQYKEFQMYFEKELVNIRTIEKNQGDRFENNLYIKWVINKIVIPLTLKGKETELKKAIKEAFLQYGTKGVKSSQLSGVEVEICTELEVV